MSRLIDADKMKEDIKQTNGRLPEWIGNLIDVQPTAYDVDKVVEQLEKEYAGAICSSSAPCRYPETIGCCYDKAINKSVEIVKGAVKDE